MGRIDFVGNAHHGAFMRGNFVKGRFPKPASREMNNRAAFNGGNPWIDHPRRGERLKCFCGNPATWYVRELGFCMVHRDDAKRAAMRDAGLL